MNWAEQMAQLKLELANCKAECDRTQWQFGQLLEKKQQADRRIVSLERENRDLKQDLRTVEKKYLVLSMNTTNSSTNHGPHQQQGGECSSSDGNSVMSSAGGRHSGTHYRTIHEDDDFDDNHARRSDGDGVSLGWGGRHFYDDQDDANSFVEQFSVGSVRNSNSHHDQNKKCTGSSAPMIDMTSIQQQQQHRHVNDKVHGLSEEFQDITMDALSAPVGDSKTLDTCNNTASTTMLYPDDDPFSTLNPHDGDAEEPKRATSWWSWGTNVKAKS